MAEKQESAERVISSMTPGGMRQLADYQNRVAQSAAAAGGGGGGGSGSTAAAIIEGIKSKSPEMAMTLANQGYAGPSLSALFGLTNYGKGLAYAAESRGNLRRAALEGQDRDRQNAALQQQMAQQGLEKSRIENQMLAQQAYDQRNPSRGADNGGTARSDGAVSPATARG